MISPVRVLAIALVQIYRYGLSPILPASCRFLPTCSSYALEALRRYGILTGGYLSLHRMLRCHPWGGCGHDPVPDLPKGWRPWGRDEWTMHPRGEAVSAGKGELGTQR